MKDRRRPGYWATAVIAGSALDRRQGECLHTVWDDHDDGTTRCEGCGLIERRAVDRDAPAPDGPTTGAEAYDHHYDR